MRRHAGGAAQTDPAHGRIAGAAAGGGARPMPRRRAGTRARRPSHVRRAGRQSRPAGNEARRVRAGRLLPVAGIDRPAARARSAAVRPQHHRRASGCASASRAKPPPIRSMPRSLISRSISSRRARVRCAMPSRRRGSTTSPASRTRSAPSSGSISTNSWPPTTRWRVSKPSSRRGRRNGNIVERSGYGRHRRARQLRCSRICTSPSARQWKAAKPGRKVIGYMPIYVPRELIHAADMLPLGIVGGGDQLEVIHGDAYYQSYICRIPRSTIELGVSGRIDFVDGMLFPSICDVIRNLSGMWKMMFPHVYSHYFDVPQNYRDDIGGNFYVNELAELRHDLGELRGKPITDDELRALDRGLQRKPPLGARALRLPGGEAVAGAGGRSLSDGARRPGAPGRGAHRHAARLSCRGARRGAADARQLPHRAHRHVLRAAAAQPDQVARTVRLLRGRRRSPAGHPLAHRRCRDRRRSAAQSFGRLPASFRVDGGQIRAQPEGKGPASGPRGQAHRRRKA